MLANGWLLAVIKILKPPIRPKNVGAFSGWLDGVFLLLFLAGSGPLAPAVTQVFDSPADTLHPFPPLSLAIPTSKRSIASRFPTQCAPRHAKSRIKRTIS